MPEIDNIQIISYSKVEDQYHILFKLENNGWREYQEYLGHISFDENLIVKEFNILLSYDSWNGIRQNLIYDEEHPEKGIKKHNNK
ncbi:MAG: hypothetical protein R2879_19485 [Saprospiraceae bacterium]